MMARWIHGVALLLNHHLPDPQHDGAKAGCHIDVTLPLESVSHNRVMNWLVGFSGSDEGNRLIYAMEVAERIDMDSYFHDPRFAGKKPNLRGSWQERCGDNFYSKNPDGTWRQHETMFHEGARYLAKDTRCPHVFAAQRFWYFGSAKITVPDKFHVLVGKRGIRVNHDPSVQAFLAWLTSTQPSGIHALPATNHDASGACAAPDCAPPRHPIYSEQCGRC